MSCANAFSGDECKILSCSKELNDFIKSSNIVKVNDLEIKKNKELLLRYVFVCFVFVCVCVRRNDPVNTE